MCKTRSDHQLFTPGPYIQYVRYTHCCWPDTSQNKATAYICVNHFAFFKVLYYIQSYMFCYMAAFYFKIADQKYSSENVYDNFCFARLHFTII